MTTRRSFLKSTALLAATAPLADHLQLLAPSKYHIGVQLWSVREDVVKNPKSTLEAVAKMGYREVEPFGFNEGKLFGLSYEEFGTILKSNGLTMNSTHSMITSKDYDESTKDITDAAKKTIDQGAKMGLKYMIVPYMADDDRKQMEKMVKVYAAAGAYARKAGVKLAYHNHNFEYEQKYTDGRLIIEWILQEIDPKDIAMQMDIYWVAVAKHNPLDWFRLYPGRWELCHAKDVADTEKHESIEVGDGTVDFKGIFRQSAKAGLKYYVVELENYKTTPLEGIDRARKGLVKILGA